MILNQVFGAGTRVESHGVRLVDSLVKYCKITDPDILAVCVFSEAAGDLLWPLIPSLASVERVDTLRGRGHRWRPNSASWGYPTA